MDFLTRYFSLIFFPFVRLRHHVLSYNPSTKKKKRLLAIPFPAAHGEEQTLSDFSAGRQGGRFFPMEWPLPPHFQNTPLPKNTPSWASSTKGADPAFSVSNAHIPSFSFYTQRPGNGTRVWGIHTTNLCVAPLGLELALLSFLALLIYSPNQLYCYCPNTQI